MRNMVDSITITEFKELLKAMDHDRAEQAVRFEKSLAGIKESIDTLHQTQLLMSHDLSKIEEFQTNTNVTMKTDIKDLQTRVRVLERFNDQNYGASKANDRTFNWFSDNWFKVVSLFILSLPVIGYLYTVMKG